MTFNIKQDGKAYINDLTVKSLTTTGTANSGTITVRASTNLVAGSLVYLSSWNETDQVFVAAKADADASGQRATFVATGSITSGADGAVSQGFRLTGQNVGGAVGDPVYLSATAGAWTLTPPTATNAIIQIVGRVAVVSASVGVVEFNLPTLNQVQIGSNELEAQSVLMTKLARGTDGQLIIGQTPADPAYTSVTGDVTITAGGITAIGSAKVTNTMLAAGAGLGALITAGLGASANYTKSTTGAQTLLASVGSPDRACLIVINVTTTFADGDGTQPTFAFGETSTTTKFATTSLLTGATAGSTFVLAGINTATKNVLVTAVAGTGTTETGAISVTILALNKA